MRRRLYIPNEVIDSISDHFSKSIKKAVDGYYSAYEDEDTMTGHLGGCLFIKNQRVRVSASGNEMPGIWTWSLDYHKFRGKGKGATESYLGADGIFELRLNRGYRSEIKSILFQSKLNWGNDKDLLEQCAKMTTWLEAAFVINFTPKGFFAISIEDAIRSRGRFSSRVKSTNLAAFLGKKFLHCIVGDTDLYYDARARKLTWRANTGQTVCTRFSAGQRFTVNVNTPRHTLRRKPKVDKELSHNEIHKYRMEVSEEEILSLSDKYTEKDVKKARKAKAIIFHPDLFTDTFLRNIMNLRMSEINNACDYISRKKKKGR